MQKISSMSYKVSLLTVFERQARILYRKYPSLKKELLTLINDLKENPIKGISIGHGCYKIRLAIASKGKGKSGGARIITHMVFKEDTLYLLSIYDKSELENLTDNEILELVKMIP